MATEVTPTPTTKPNLLLVVAIIGGLLIAAGQGFIDVSPTPAPTPVPIPSPTPNPVPNPVPTPNPVPNPQPNPNPVPNPEPPVVLEEFPNLPPTYAQISEPIKASLFTKEKADDALTLARYFRDGATVLRNDPTITSNDKFIKIHTQALTSLAAAYPGMAKRNVGLAKAIDDVLGTQGLEITQWDESKRKSMAEAMDAVSYRCLEAYEQLTKNNPTKEVTIIKDKVA